LAAAITHPRELLAALGLDQGLLPAAQTAAKRFPMLVPRGYAALMKEGDRDDPLLRQVLPVAAELQQPGGFSTDPTGDRQALCAQGILKKYPNRALLVVTGACAIHCRYCFRRHFAYERNAMVHDRNRAAVKHLATDVEVSEVILSGGDPLMIDDEGFSALVRAIEAVSHVKRLRLHTRLPVVLPSRITERLCRTLADTRLPVVLVTHVNHAHELGAEARAALDRLRGTGSVLLNQSVLLRGVNDSAATLADLSETLFDSGVLPYYLHLLDRVTGAAHFEVAAEEGAELVTQLRARLPGYLVPRLVEEVPGAAFKRPVY
jgi:EF-P beta-lysylation protein EpmB